MLINDPDNEEAARSAQILLGWSIIALVFLVGTVFGYFARVWGW